jgi:hypothetical protein
MLLMNRKIYVRFEVFTAVTMKNGVFWNVTPCGSFKNHAAQHLRRPLSSEKYTLTLLLTPLITLGMNKKINIAGSCSLRLVYVTLILCKI